MKYLLVLFTFAFAISTHSQQKIYASDLLKDIKEGKDITISNAIIEGVLDMTYMNEALPKLPKRKKGWWNKGGSNTIEKEITSKISFIDCTFNDDVLAYIPDEDSGYTFIANFENNVIIKNSVFKGKAMFKYSDFIENSNFSGTKFLGNSTFKYAKFQKDISFQSVQFKKPATFKYAEFNRFVSFANSIFKETATYKYTKFKKGVSFNNVKFEEDLNIKYTKVNGDFNIKNMKVNYEIDSKYTKINGLSFNKYILKN